MLKIPKKSAFYRDPEIKELEGLKSSFKEAFKNFLPIMKPLCLNPVVILFILAVLPLGFFLENDIYWVGCAAGSFFYLSLLIPYFHAKKGGGELSLNSFSKKNVFDSLFAFLKVLLLITIYMLGFIYAGTFLMRFLAEMRDFFIERGTPIPPGLLVYLAIFLKNLTFGLLFFVVIYKFTQFQFACLSVIFDPEFKKKGSVSSSKKACPWGFFHLSSLNFSLASSFLSG